MSSNPERPVDGDFDDEERIRSEFDSMVSGLSLDESSPSTFLEELEKLERTDRFVPPNPATQTPRSFLFSAKRAIFKWIRRDYRDDDGVAL